MNAESERPTELIHPDRRSVRAALQELQLELRALYGGQAPTVLVYGSYARAEEGNTSDIDLLLIYSHPIRPGREIQRVGSILANLNLRYQVLISVLPASVEDFQQATDVFWQALRREGVAIKRI